MDAGTDHHFWSGLSQTRLLELALASWPDHTCLCWSGSICRRANGTSTSEQETAISFAFL